MNLHTDNLMARGAGHAYSALLEAAETETASRPDPEDTALADIDGFTDWLCGKCSMSAPQTNVESAFGADFLDYDRASTPKLVALMLYPRADVRSGAIDELQKRYLRSKGIGTPRINVSHPHPAIPVRDMDYCATFAGYEPGEPIGHGATKDDAIKALLIAADEAQD